MAIDLSKFIARFVEEAREHVEKLNNGLVSLEKNPEDSETVNTVFRSAHTIKGSSRMMKLAAITEVAHSMEDALGALREKRISHSRELADLLFKGIDVISAMIEKVAAGEEIAMDTSALCEKLQGASEGQFSKEDPLPGIAVKEPLTEEKTLSEPAPETKVELKTKTGETVRIKAWKLDELIKLLGEVVSNQNRLKQRLLDIRELEKTAGRNAELAGEVPPEMANDLFAKAKQLTSAFREDTTINEMLVTDLQEKALTMRMIPFSTIFDSFHRLVRDISASLGKDVDFIVEGGNIELDRKMMEQLGDPLIHMVRNSIDHGIESPEERRTAGKDPRGKLRLIACYDAGSVIIELSDDGRGVSLAKIKERALKRKMFNEEALNEMSESALIDLIYHPGFSTSAIVTDISGRGVGMDVVRKNIIENLRGTVRVETEEAKGTTFYIRLPLTLAIMRILLFRAAGTAFGITSHYVTEMLRALRSDLISVVDKKAIRLREEFIPVVGLRSLLALRGNGGVEKEDVLIVIVQIGSEKLGLIVDELLDEENMVIKSLPEHMKSIILVSGVTISGRNELINILHVPAMIEASKKASEAKLRREKEKEGVNILVVDDSVNTREIEKSILEAHGYFVAIAEDGMDALEKTKGFKYDLIITDVEMPNLDGFSLTERLRADENYRDTPIIIVTSRQKEEDKRRGIEVGADAYIIKGAFDQTNLLDAIKNLIG
ncbi:MAG: hybrid sensor histidine kinase/response regulator [Thermodesulfovibrionales bacterium]|nr:hybrid sensor histidine kinase/response regulator [Thermodesulfovibrionales bacterium]